MRNTSEETVYPPRYYGKKMMRPSDWAGTQVETWERAQAEMKAVTPFYCICLSRKISAGAIVVSDFLSEITGYPNRQILENSTYF